MRQKRAEAVELYDEAVKLVADGKRAKAEKLVSRLLTEFVDLVDITARARDLLKEKPAEEAPVAKKEESGKKAACAACGGEIRVAQGTMTAWCEACESYVRVGAD